MPDVPADLPDDLPIVERQAVRVVVRDVLGRVLLFRARETTSPDFGFWWELPGGGLEAGEDHVDAAVRELHEETGIVVERDQVGPPTWRRTATFRSRHRRLLQHEVVVLVDLDVTGPDVDETLRLDYEKEDYVDFRWTPVAEIVGSTDRFYPGRLPQLLTPLLAGTRIDEPFELFS